jgi:hypothetical protein
MLGAAVLMYLMKPIGWWMGLAVIIIGFVSAILTLAQRGMLEFYARGHVHPEILGEMKRSPAMMGATPIVFITITMAFCVGYMVWVHRYFCTRTCRP